MSRKAYLVLRRPHADSWSLVPVRAFPDRAAAEAHVAELHRVARRTMNPFTVYDLYSDFGPQESFGDRLAAAGMDDPSDDDWYDGEWLAWWDIVAETLTDDQVAAVWRLFGERHLYEVTEVEVED